jgi:hypothetical protein
VNYWKKKSCEGEGKGMMVALGPFKAVQWHGAVRGGWWHGAVRGGCACHVTEEEQGGPGRYQAMGFGASSGGHGQE